MSICAPGPGGSDVCPRPVDDDGDLCIPYRGRTLWATLLVEDSATWARVWTVAATGLKRTAKLLREINEINVAIRACRALLDGGQLIVAAEIICESLEPGELTQIAGRVVSYAEQVGEPVQLVHGAPTSREVSQAQA